VVAEKYRFDRGTEQCMHCMTALGMNVKMPVCLLKIPEQAVNKNL
jgi:hypothetical protein